MDRNSMVLYGKNSVCERLKTNPKSINKIFLQDNFNVPEIEKLIELNNIPTQRLSLKELVKIKHGENLQGIIARVSKFEYTPFEDLLNRAKNKQLTLIFLDRIYDPQNLGAIIRTVACFGGFAIIIPKFEACEVNETVLHIASGGENYILVSMVSNLSHAITAAKESGYWIMGTQVGDEAEDINEVSFPFPLGFVLGSEGKGIRYGVRKHLDMKVGIPMKGAKLSFNVVIACAIFCHEIVKQRRDEDKLTS
ncbi:MAG: 23S rRNA (guanosine(2251)-2'-O)-methyltransferase RlmB [bacterium]